MTFLTRSPVAPRDLVANTATAPPRKRRFSWIRRHKRLSGMLSFLLIAGCSAMAAWLISGTGPGAAKIGDLSPVSVSEGTPVGKSCLPGGTCDLSFHVVNPNGPVTLYKMAVDSGSPLPQGCAANLTVTDQPSLQIQVPTGSSDVQIADAGNLSPTTPDTCKNMVVSTRPVLMSFSAGQ